MCIQDTELKHIKMLLEDSMKGELLSHLNKYKHSSFDYLTDLFCLLLLVRAVSLLTTS